MCTLFSFPIVEFQVDSKGGFYTTCLFWECGCEQDFIQPHDLPECYACGWVRDESPHARLETLASCGSHLEPRLIEALFVVAGIPIPF
jgi:hypothetical protein